MSRARRCYCALCRVCASSATTAAEATRRAAETPASLLSPSLATGFRNPPATPLPAVLFSAAALAAKAATRTTATRDRSIFKSLQPPREEAAAATGQTVARRTAAWRYLEHSLQVNERHENRFLWIWLSSFETDKRRSSFELTASREERPAAVQASKRCGDKDFFSFKPFDPENHPAASSSSSGVGAGSVDCGAAVPCSSACSAVAAPGRCVCNRERRCNAGFFSCSSAWLLFSQRLQQWRLLPCLFSPWISSSLLPSGSCSFSSSSSSSSSSPPPPPRPRPEPRSVGGGGAAATDAGGSAEMLQQEQQQHRERLLACEGDSESRAAPAGDTGKMKGNREKAAAGRAAGGTEAAGEALAARGRPCLATEEERHRREQERRSLEEEISRCSNAAAVSLQEQHHLRSRLLSTTERDLSPATATGAAARVLQTRRQYQRQMYMAKADAGRDAVWLLLLNLGSPAQPTYGEVWEFLSQFLTDPRVIETTQILWTLFLKFFILPTRSYPTSRLYRRIWHADLEAEAAEAAGDTEGVHARRKRLLRASESSGVWGEPPLIRYTAALGKNLQRRFNAFFAELQQSREEETRQRRGSHGGGEAGGAVDLPPSGDEAEEESQQSEQQLLQPAAELSQDYQQQEQQGQGQKKESSLQSCCGEKIMLKKYLSFIDKARDERSDVNAVRVMIGMRYGHPSVSDALEQAQSQGCRKLLVLPLYPQTVAATTSSAYDAVFKELQKWRVMPDLRIVSGYADHPAYIRAVAASIRRFWNKNRRVRGGHTVAREATCISVASTAGSSALGSQSLTSLLQGEGSAVPAEASVYHTLPLGAAAGTAQLLHPTVSTAADENDAADTEDDDDDEESAADDVGEVEANAVTGATPAKKLLGGDTKKTEGKEGKGKASSSTQKKNGLPRKVEKLIFSYHGIPQSSGRQAGDIYQCLCLKTTRLVAQQLRLQPGDYEVAYQSRVGGAAWVQPYLEERLQALAGAGYTRVDVVEPGFAVDCLETLEEIGMTLKEQWGLWTEGRGELRSIPCLNGSEEGTGAIFEIVKEQMLDWFAVRGRF